MEGNNEIDIDGRQRVIDYLGTECSFGFCWGFRNHVCRIAMWNDAGRDAKSGEQDGPPAISTG